MRSVGVLMVCMGNICRSPTAHGVFVKKVYDAGLQMRLRVDSAGTYAGMKGEPPDKRAQQLAIKRGYDLSPLRARQLRTEDFRLSQFIIVMDDMNLKEVRKRAEVAGFDGTVAKLLDFSPDAQLRGQDVPDPYYGGLRGFETVFDLVEPACDGLLQHVIANALNTAR